MDMDLHAAAGRRVTKTCNKTCKSVSVTRIPKEKHCYVSAEFAAYEVVDQRCAVRHAAG